MPTRRSERAPAAEVDSPERIVLEMIYSTEVGPMLGG